MKVTELIAKKGGTAFSFEVLPPLKGTGIRKLFDDIDALREFGPTHINITTHRSEYVYQDLGNGLVQRERLRRRPGTVAVAAAIQQRYGIPVVPHILCSGFSKEETEYVLLDLQFLGITNLLLLRGDKAKEDKNFIPTEGGHSHTTELQQQVNRFNAGQFVNGDPIEAVERPFSYGVACYPEKHEEAANMESDFLYFKQKIKQGAEYAVTQLFFDNDKYFRFVEKARHEGITSPIIPGIKPLRRRAQLTMIPRTFHCDIPEALAHEALRCKDDAAVQELGVEWAITQCKELIARGAPCIHFYTVAGRESVRRIAKAVF